MVNQLIQKENRPPIKKTEQEVTYATVVTLEKRLIDGFNYLEHTRGIKALNSIKEEHDSLQKLFIARELSDSIVNVDKIKSLTDSLYSQGLHLLSSAFESAQQLATTNIEQIESEISELETELQNCSETIRPIVSERIEKNKKSLKSIKGYRDRVDELLCQSGLCKDSIREIRLELPELMSHKSQDEYEKLMLELDTRIAFAQRVKAEYMKQGL